MIDTNEYARRLFRNEGWEGLTWILDLLPDWSQHALDALDAFIQMLSPGKQNCDAWPSSGDDLPQCYPEKAAQVN
jgi:hypothetical protein